MQKQSEKVQLPSEISAARVPCGLCLPLCPPAQMEQQNNGIDVDHDADLAYNSLKVRLAVLWHSWASGHWVLSASLLTRRAIGK